MLIDVFQYQLLEYHEQSLDLADAELNYWPEFVPNSMAWELYKTILSETDWRQESISLYGKTHKVPRLSSWIADSDVEYGYSNMTMQPVPWNDNLFKLKEAVEQQTKATYNSVLLNYYRDGQDSNGWHSDDEKELGRDPVIASLSLGASRDFHLRHKTKKGLKQSIALEHGSLLLMGGSTQHNWQHHVPKRANAGPRINLTFRDIK
jgi:alkylated DNA repair dioxygenase AlkB